MTNGNYTGKIDNRIIRSPIVAKPYSHFRLLIFLMSLSPDSFIGDNTVGELTGMSENTIGAARKALVKLGAIKILDKGGLRGGKPFATRYRVHPFDNWNLNETYKEWARKALNPISSTSTANIEPSPPQTLSESTAISAVSPPQTLQTNNVNTNNNNINIKTDESKYISQFLKSEELKEFRKSKIFSKKEKKTIKRFLVRCFLILQGKKFFQDLPKEIETFVAQEGELVPIAVLVKLLNRRFTGVRGRKIFTDLEPNVRASFEEGMQIWNGNIALKSPLVAPPIHSLRKLKTNSSVKTPRRGEQ